jgi:hypothetical protein
MPKKGFLRRDRTGERHGRLVVIRFVGRKDKKNRNPIWLCRCDCGKLTRVVGENIFRTSSCGCLKSEKMKREAFRHGHNRPGRRSLTYVSWSQMLARVRAKTGRRWIDYGARGITVCKRWEKFENFLADMGERPSRAHSIDRKNNDGNYTPENCRWATPRQQRLNQRTPERVALDRAHSIGAP